MFSQAWCHSFCSTPGGGGQHQKDQVTTPPSPPDQVTTPPSPPPRTRSQHLPPPGTRSQHLPSPQDQVTTPPSRPPGPGHNTSPPPPTGTVGRRAVHIALIFYEYTRFCLIFSVKFSVCEGSINSN